MRIVAGFLSVFSGMLLAPVAWAQGGCGSVCIPFDILDTQKADVDAKTFRLTFAGEYASFHHFKVGDRDVPNPGGAKANIGSLSAILDYGVSSRTTISLFLPYVSKVQHTNMFGRRAAEGLGDVTLFGRYRLTKNTSKPSIVGSLGVKFPTGSVEEPGGGVANLPQPFQTGSGAYDLVPALNYFQTFARYSLFGDTFARIPLEDNKFGYEFGNEYEVHFGVLVPLSGNVDLTTSLDYLHAEQDTDGMPFTAPGPFHDGNEVITSGGNFVSLTPGVRVRVGKTNSLQVRVQVPVSEDWHGSESVTAGPAMQPAGQVAPDLTLQISLTHTFGG